jgi:hypothetical protein
VPVFATVLDAWSGKLRATVLSHTVESVSFESKDTAVVKGKYRLEGLRFWDLKKRPSDCSFQAQKNSRWMIAKAELLRGSDN